MGQPCQNGQVTRRGEIVNVVRCAGAGSEMIVFRQSSTQAKSFPVWMC